MPDTAMRRLLAFVRTLRSSEPDAPMRIIVKTTDGQVLEGHALNQTSQDLQLAAGDNRVHLLRRDGERYRPVTSQADWPTYNGQIGGNRYSTIDQINRSSVARLAPAWVFTIPDSSRLEVTPVVVGGIMYVTTANECYALDAGSGRRIWHFKRPRTKGLAGDAAAGINRGVAVAGDRVFMATDHAHLVALDRFSGKLLWDTTMADWRETTGPRPRRSRSATWSCLERPAATKASAASWRHSIRRRGGKCGASGQCHDQASLAQRPGAARRSIIRVRRHG